jgi:hypothetical protein
MSRKEGALQINFNTVPIADGRILEEKLLPTCFFNIFV